MLWVVACLIVAEICNGQSLIIKFRSETALSVPSRSLQDVSNRYFSTHLERSQRFYTPTLKGQTPQTVASFGLERIVVIPIKKAFSLAAVAAELASLPEVEWAQPNYIYHIDAAEPPNDSLFGEQYAHRIMQVQEAWETTNGDSSIKIGFVDTGVDWFHPDLVGQFAINSKEDINGNGLFDAWSHFIKQNDDRGVLVGGDLDDIDNDGNGYTDDVIGYDFVDQEFLNFGDAAKRDPIPGDEHSHGTSVAGVIGALANNQVGVAGIAPGCRMVVLRAFDATGNAEDDDIASAIVYAADNGVKVLNLSFGDIWPSLLQRDAIRYAESKGCLVFASSGNRGGSGRHYPSDFDECVSVGATGPNDVLYGFTTTGTNMDIVAPGADIITTTIDDNYRVVSGTSFSAPAAAAVAGLVLSKNPKLSPRELRSMLASTTDDIFPTGFDREHANGRVNAQAALRFPGSASIKITSPNTNEGFRIGDTINIIGSAASTFFSSYTISLGEGLNPDIAGGTITYTLPNEKQVVSDTLARLFTKDLKQGTYTIGLIVAVQGGRTVEERITIELKSTAPTLVNATLDTIFIAEKTGLLIQGEADTLTYATLFYRPLGSTRWNSKSDDRYSRRHALLLTTEDAAPGAEYELVLSLRGAGRDSVTHSFIAMMPDASVPERGFVQKTYALPAGFVLDTVIDATQGGTVIESVFPPGQDFGPVVSFAFDAALHTFRKTDSTKIFWVPRDLGSLDGVSRDLMLQGGKKFIICQMEQSRTFSNIIREDTNESLGLTQLGFANTDGDSRDEVVVLHQVNHELRLQDVIELRSGATNDFPLIAELPNPTSPAPQFRDNRYQKPDVRAKDLTGDGNDEIVILDDDADLLIYTRNTDGTYRILAIDSNDGFTEGTMVSIGDLDGDARQDIVFAYHTSYDENPHGEYDPKYWTVKTLIGNGDGTFESLAPLYFWNARSDAPYRSSLAVMKNVTGAGADELALSLFPEFYLFKYDALSNKMMPVWHYLVSITPRSGLVHDFDGNGIPEFAIGADDSTRFFERSYLLSGRTPAPSGLEAIPRDTDRVDLIWGAVPGATLYYVLRAKDGDDSLSNIASTSTPFFSDTTVVNLSTYIYSIVAVDSSREEPNSEPSYAVDAFVHPKPVVSEISSHREFVRVKVSQPLRSDALEGAGFLVDGDPCLTAAVASDSFIVLRMASQIELGEHELTLRTTRVRDIWNSPVDTGLVGRWEHSPSEPGRRFYIVKWRFEGSKSIYVEFNARPAENALDVSHYTLTPYGTLARVRRDDANPNAVIIDLVNTQIAALGVPFVLCAHDITDEFGTPIEETEGNCAGVTLVEPDLANIMAYPNPVRIGDEKLTFGRLTAEAEISIYTTSNRFLRRLQTKDRSGGVEWDLRDETGKELLSGLYIYHVTGKDENGNNVEPNEAKFVIIRDR